VIDLDALVIGPTIGVFGETVALADGSAAPPTFQGVFDSAYLELPALGGEMIADLNISTRRPVLGVQLSSMPVEPLQGMELVIRGKIYSVKEVREDGHGHAKLLLSLGSYEP
jgi:hypothetical protein